MELELFLPDRIGNFQLNDNFNNYEKVNLIKLKRFDYEDFLTYKIGDNPSKVFIQNSCIKAIQIGHTDKLMYKGENLIGKDIIMVLSIFSEYGKFEKVNDVYFNKKLQMTLYVSDDNTILFITIESWND